MKIRQATNADTPHIRKILFSTMKEYGICCDPENAEADLEDLESSYIGAGGLFEVLTNDAGTIQGMYGLYPLSEQECELRKMYFIPAIRGKGWGKKSVQRLIQEAKALGFTRISLETAVALKEAIQLYKSLGFQNYCSGDITTGCDQAMFLELT